MACSILELFGMSEFNVAATGSDAAPARRKHILHPVALAVGQREDVAVSRTKSIDGRLILATRTSADVLHDREAAGPWRDLTRDMVGDAAIEPRDPR